MTQTPPNQHPTLAHELSARGIRLTAQRKALIETMQEAGPHLDAATLLALARKRRPAINRATVYRTLELLKQLGLIDELDLMHVEGEKHYYEVRPRRNHAHATCVQCGRVEEFAIGWLDRIRGEVNRLLGFEVQVARLEVGGRCRSCRRPEGAKEEPLSAAAPRPGQSAGE